MRKINFKIRVKLLRATPLVVVFVVVLPAIATAASASAAAATAAAAGVEIDIDVDVDELRCRWPRGRQTTHSQTLHELLMVYMYIPLFHSCGWGGRDSVCLLSKAVPLEGQ